MDKPRIIARLDIKTNKLIKGIHLEGLRVIGNPVEYAQDYYEQGADELLYLDSVASLYNRSYIKEVIKDTAKNVFIPITVGGGIKNLFDVEKILRAGADKVAINTAAVKDPSLITQVAQTFGSQCMVLQVDVKSTSTCFEIYIDGGRERTGVNALEWVKKAQDLGCGEVLLTSIDKDGTKRGFDYDLLKIIAPAVKVPLIISSGFGDCHHLEPLVDLQIDGIAIGSALHYNNCTVSSIKNFWKSL